jgi:hypothetical protein
MQIKNICSHVLINYYLAYLYIEYVYMFFKTINIISNK